MRYLCNKVSRLEWSGVLFYSVKGSIRDVANIKNMVITLEHIFLMDIGTPGTTEFIWNEDVVQFAIEHDEWKFGHIHSHNTMGVFFSDTDWGELNDNCSNHNYYLSVIVNNAMDIQAKIAFTGQPQEYTCLDENGQDYKISVSPINPKMFLYDCDISLIPTPVVNEEFEFRLELIEDKSKKGAEEKAKKFQSQVYTNNNFSQNNFTENSKIIRGQETANKNNKKSKNKGDREYDRYFIEQNRNKIKTPDYDPTKNGWPIEENLIKEPKGLIEWERDDKEASQELLDKRKMTMTEEFGTVLLRLGADNPDDHIDDAMFDIDQCMLGEEDYSAMIIHNYQVYHDNFYEGIPKYNDIKSTTEGLISFFTNAVEQEGYDFLDPIIEGLKQFLIDSTIKEEEIGGRI